MIRSVSVPACREHDHRYRRQGAESPAHLESVHRWEHQVEHDEIGGIGQRPVERDPAVGDRLDSEAVELQVAGDDLRDCVVVVDDEYPRSEVRHLRERRAERESASSGSDPFSDP